MARRRNPNTQLATAVAVGLRLFRSLSTRGKVVVVVLLLVAAGLFLAVRGFRPGGPGVDRTPVPPGAVVFMFWNMENLFDDRDDRRRSVDEPYDNWFAHDAAARGLKYDRLAEIVLAQNGGKGPDLLAGCELESRRAAELLTEVLNAKLPDGVPKYQYLAAFDFDAGRHIIPCLIARLPIDEARTHLLGSRQRILATRVVANGHGLTVVVSHWTSQLSDDGSGKDGGRERYAAAIYAAFEKDVAANPEADFLVCGDFNDTPDSDPVAVTLHMTADRAAVTPGARPPRLFNLMAGKPADRFGTHYYSGKGALVYDQIGVSAGLLDDAGWGVDPDSVRVATEGMIRAGTRVRRPWRFGNEKDDAAGRGYSDHFPVLVNLTLGPPAP